MLRDEICWDRFDLVRRLSKSLEIAIATLNQLGSSGYADPNNRSIKIPPEKIISETAVLVHVTSAIDGVHEVRPLIERVVELLIPLARSERALLGLCAQPSLALDYAEAHLCLSSIGYTDSNFDRLLTHSRSAQVSNGGERLPHRMLQQHWLSNLGAARIGCTKATPAASILNQPIDVLRIGRDDFYAFTHALMYLTAFGTRSRRLPRAKATMLAEAEAALACCLDEEDYDLAGELLMAWPMTESTWSSAATFGFRVLANLEDEVGILPAPTTSFQSFDPQPAGESYSAEFLAAAYHTAYVMGLLCATALKHGRAPPREVPRVRSSNGHGHELPGFLGIDKRWRLEFDKLSISEREALTGFLITISIQRKIKECDFAAVYEFLRVAYDKQLADLPAVSQAAELLDRLTTFASIRETNSVG